MVRKAVITPVVDADSLHSMGILAVAQVGDAAFELMVRVRLCVSEPTAAKLHTARVRYVNAAAQAEYLNVLKPILDEGELDIVRRGGNAPVNNVPKAVTRVTYAAATGFEALWGHLYLSGRHERLDQLFEVIWSYEKTK